MKLFIFCVFLLGSVFVNAQTVKKVSAQEALVQLESKQDFSEGEKVFFLDDKLNVAGQGEIKKISSGGSKAIVKILSGSVKVGMVIENTQPTTQREKPQMKMNPEGISYSSLSEKEREILARGEITQFQYIAGGIVGTYPIGLGVGHAIQGRYLEKGWIFTVGEVGSLLAFVAGVGDCWDSYNSRYRTCEGGLAVAGIVGYVAFRIWEIVDVWAAPPEHNRRLLEIKARLERGSMSFKPALIPLADGGMLGVRVSF